MKVISLFDGISCGMLALNSIGIVPDEYIAYEIEPSAIKISSSHFPTIRQMGSVVNADFSQFVGADIVMGGFPCQDLSISKRDREGLAGKRSGLFWELVRAINEIKPKYFLVENNWNMPADAKQTISEVLGVQPILINSADFSAQQRKRLYWTNIPLIEKPKVSTQTVKDILSEADFDTINYISQVDFNGKEDTAYHKTTHRIGQIGNGGQGQRVYSVYGKSATLTANGGGQGAKTGLYHIGDTVRMLSPIEAERLQGLPDDYTAGFSKTKRYQMIGNGWTVPVITYLLQGVKNDID